MDKINEYAAAKLILGVAAIVIGFPAFAFALFGWVQSAQSVLGIYSRYICVFGSLGAISVGASLARDGFRTRKSRLPIKF